MSATLVDEAPVLPTDKDQIECGGCGVAFDYSGRGSRSGRKCPECTSRAKADKVDKPSIGVPTAKLGKQMADMYAMLAMGLMLVDPVCATAVGGAAESCGAAWEQAAKESPAIRRVLTRMVTVSVTGQIVSAHIPIVLAVAQHHVLAKAVPDGQVV